MQNDYKISITAEMIRRGYQSREDMQWECEEIIEAEGGTCQLCGHPITYRYICRNRVDGKVIITGSECVRNITGINPDSVAFGEMLLKKQKNEVQKIRKKIREEERIKTNLEKYPEEIQYIKHKVKTSYVETTIYNIFKVLLEGTREVKPADIAIIRGLMVEDDKDNKDFMERFGGKALYMKFENFIFKQVADMPNNDFWISISKGLKKQQLSDKQIEAVNRNMNTHSNNVIKDKLKEDYDTFVEFVKNQDSNNDFWRSINSGISRSYLSDKQIEAVIRNMEKSNIKIGDKISYKDMNIACEIEVPNWLARKHSISKFMKGNITKESNLGYYFIGRAFSRPSSFCFRCGRILTHPVSLVVGFGAECSSKIGVPWTADNDEQIEKMKALIEQVTFEGWLPKNKTKINTQV